MTPPPVLARVTGALEHLEISYMLAGSFASSHHGAPRTTQDIDIVVSPSLTLLETRRPSSVWARVLASLDEG